MASPLISVIIPTYNRATTLGVSVDSALGQTFKDIEVIVVDDGSEDHTREVLTRFKDRIRYISKDNGGCASARNAGLTEAKGDWIAFLDSDDVWLPKKLETQVSDLERHPDAVAHATNAFIIRNHTGGETDLFSFIGFSPAWTVSLCVLRRPLLEQLKSGFGWPQCILARASTLRDCGALDTNLRVFCDTDLFYRLAARGTWIVNRKPLARIQRIENDSIAISNFSKNRITAFTELSIAYGRLLESSDLSPEERPMVRKLLADARSCLGIEYVKKGERLKGAGFLLSAVKLDPSLKNSARSVAMVMPSFVIRMKKAGRVGSAT